VKGLAVLIGVGGLRRDDCSPANDDFQLGTGPENPDSENLRREIMMRFLPARIVILLLAPAVLARHAFLRPGISLFG